MEYRERKAREKRGKVKGWERDEEKAREKRKSKREDEDMSGGGNMYEERNMT